jgi:hypothetical protein
MTKAHNQATTGALASSISPTRQYPLRQVVGYDGAEQREILECGHRQPMRSDCFGAYNAYRRRCRKCFQGQPPDAPRLPLWMVDCLRHIKQHHCFGRLTPELPYLGFEAKQEVWSLIDSQKLASPSPEGWIVTEQGYAYIQVHLPEYKQAIASCQ